MKPAGWHKWIPILCAPVVLGCTPLAPGNVAGCAASDAAPRFDAPECLEVRRDPVAPMTATVLVNRCDSPVAMLVVVCDLAAQPACKSDPLHSKGWSAHRGVEYVAPVRGSARSTKAWRKTAAGQGDGPQAAALVPFAPGLPRGWRAQIAACRLSAASTGLQDPCVRGLTELKHALDAGGGKSMRAALDEMRPRCPA